MENDEWVADENERAQTEATTAVLPPREPDPAEQEDDEESLPEPSSLSPTKPNEEVKNTLAESVCIEDSNVLLVMLVGKKLEAQGRLRVTSQRLAFYPAGKMEQDPLLQLPIGYLSRCDRTLDDRITTLEVFVKYNCSFKLRCGQGRFEFALRAHQIISQLIKSAWRLAVEWGGLAGNATLCQPVREWPSGKDCYEYDNSGYKRMPGYPERFMVPLNYLSRNNPQERLVVFSFSYRTGKEEVSVWRTGPGRADPSEEEWVSKSRLPSSRSFTLDIKNKGIGSSKSSACRMIELQGLPLLRDSFSSLFRIAFHNHQTLKWLANFNQTRWLDQVALLLQEASALVSRITAEQAQMITILADCDARAAQLVVLAQVLLFPENRTIDGFGALMEREVLQWGRAGKKEEGDRGAAVIQLLDAVFQLTCIYPLSFEFSQNLLVLLAEHVYSNRFGNFLLAARAIRDDDRQTPFKCQSIWKWAKSVSQETRNAYLILNPFYVDFKECDIYQLRELPSLKSLRIWNGFFFKRFREKNPDYHIYHRYQQLHAQHLRNKRDTEALRKQLSQQHKILMQRKEALKDLKALESS